jgi:hypothetical protein
MLKFFRVFGIVVVALLALAQYRGWSMTSYDEVPNVPNTVRENPGSYRAIYMRTYHK